MKKIEERFALVALGPVTVFLAIYLLELISFAIIGKLSTLLVSLALVLPAFLPRALFNSRDLRLALFSALSSLILIAVSFWLSSLIYDTSYDGQTYHQLAIDYLYKGWNFFTGNRDAISHLKPEYQLPLLHYPKFPWLVESTIYGLTGDIEGAKSLNLVLFVCAGLLTYVAILQLSFSKFSAIFFAAALSLNPVSICQLWTSYIDGILASITLFLIAALSLFFTTRKSIWAHIAGLGALILLHIKFTAISILVSLLLILFLGKLRKSSSCKTSFKIISLYLLLAGVVVGFHPYMTNLLVTGNPVYPVAGYSPLGSTPPPSDWPTFSLVHGQQPKVLTNLPGPAKTVLSLFSRTADPLNPDAEFNYFFQFKITDFSRFVVPDLRLGGFGPVYAIALLASFFAFTNFKRDQASFLLTSLAAAIFLSSLLNPESWWSRYSPQLWMLPLILSAVGKDSKLLLGNSLILIASSIIILFINTKSAYVESKKVGNLLITLERFRGGTLPGETLRFYSNDLRLKQLDITLSQPIVCLNKIYFAGSPSYVCLPPI